MNNQEILSALEYSDIAGGELYDNDITRDDADVIVRTSDEFTDHCGDSGKVVWIPGDESIDITGWSGTVRATIASDRGIDGSDGALIYSDSHGEGSHAWSGGSGIGVLQMRGRARLTGLRYRGPYHDYYDNPEYPGYIPLDSGSSSERSQKRSQRSSRGMKIHSSDVEIDNIEIYGWANQAIQMGSKGSGAFDPHIHHIYGHDCMMVGAGYVIDVLRGHPTIEKSYFNAARHAIDGFGHENAGYTLQDCVFGPSTFSHAVDMHCLAENGYGADTNPNSSTWRARAGGTMIIRRNTFCYTHDIEGDPQECIVIRGVPKDEVVIENNRFMHSEPPSRNSGNSSVGNAWRQVNVMNWDDVDTNSNGFTPNFTYRNNQFNSESEEWTEGYGAPVNLMNPVSEDDIDRDALIRRRKALQSISEAFEKMRNLLS